MYFIVFVLQTEQSPPDITDTIITVTTDTIITRITITVATPHIQGKQIFITRMLQPQWLQH
jgi:hypothetical protein